MKYKKIFDWDTGKGWIDAQIIWYKTNNVLSVDSIINAKTGEKIEYNDDLIDWKELRYSSIPEYKAE